MKKKQLTSTSQLIYQAKGLKNLLKQRQKYSIKTEKLNIKKLEKSIKLTRKKYGKYLKLSSKNLMINKFNKKSKEDSKKKFKEILLNLKSCSFIKWIKKINEKSKALTPMQTIILISIFIMILFIITPNKTIYIDNSNINYMLKKQEGFYSIILFTIALWFIAVGYYLYSLYLRVEPIGDITGGEE